MKNLRGPKHFRHPSSLSIFLNHQPNPAGEYVGNEWETLASGDEGNAVWLGNITKSLFGLRRTKNK